MHSINGVHEALYQRGIKVIHDTFGFMQKVEIKFEVEGCTKGSEEVRSRYPEDNGSGWRCRNCRAGGSNASRFKEISWIDGHK